MNSPSSMAFSHLATSFYSTVTTIPSPSPNPYTSYASFPNLYGYGYSSYYNTYPQPPVENTNYWSNTSYPSFYSHPCTSYAPSPLPYSQPQPPPPYSPSPPYCHPPPYQPIDVNQRSFGEMLQTSQRSFNEFTQICQKFQNDSRASHELIKASQNSIKESFEAFCKELQEHFQGVEKDQEEIVEKDYEEKPEETEMFLVHGTSPKMVVQLPQMGTETITSQKSQGNLKNTIANYIFTNEAPNMPTPKPSESGKFKRRNGSMTKHKLSFIHSLVACPLLEPPDTYQSPSPPVKPPDPDFPWSDTTRPPLEPPDNVLLPQLPPPSKPPDPRLQQLRVESQVTGEPTMPPPPPKPPDRKWVQLSHHKTKFTPSDSTRVIDQNRDPSRPISGNRSTPLDSHLHKSLPSFSFPLKQAIPKISEPSDNLPFPVAKSEPLQESTIYEIMLNDPDATNNVITGSHVKPYPLDKHLISANKSHPFTDNTIRVNAFQATTLRHVFPSNSRTSHKTWPTPSNSLERGC